MLECTEFPHAYDNPGSVNSPARTRLPSYTHQRSSSNVSASSQSNVNPSFRLDDEPVGEYPALYSPGHSLVRRPGQLQHSGVIN